MTETEGKIMKKILIATTALVATAGVAAADITFSGNARLGLQYTDNGTTTTTDMDQRFTLGVTGSTTTDSGLALSTYMQIRSDEAGGESSAGQSNAPRFTVGFGDLTIAGGQMNGALDSMPGIFSGSVGLTGLGWGNVVTNFATLDYADQGDGQTGWEAIYSVNGLGLHVSAEHDGDTELAVSYSFSGISFAAGTSSTTTAANAEWVVTAGASMGAVNFGVAAAESAEGNRSTTLSASGTVQPGLTMAGYIANDQGQADESAYGVGLVMDLGGGASFRAGMAKTHGTSRADAGINFTF
jgi:outer membrane protein OmpU